MRISKPSGGEIPEPYNENDVFIFNALISKFLCDVDIFSKEIFLEGLIQGTLKPSGGYPIQGKKDALTNPNNPINHMIHYSLGLLTQMDLVKAIKGNSVEQTYMATSRLKALCPRIRQYDMPFVEGLVKELTNIETEIRNDKSYNSITNLLKKLRTRKQVRKDETSLDNNTLAKLERLGVINISLNQMLSLSNIGKVLVI